MAQKLRLLLLDDDGRLLPHDDSRGLLLLWRIDGPLVAGHAERDEAAWPDSADEQDPGDTKRDDPTCPMRPGMCRRLDHDGGRLDGLPAAGRRPGPRLLLLAAPVARAAPGLHDCHGRGLHDPGLRLHDDGAPTEQPPRLQPAP